MAHDPWDDREAGYLDGQSGVWLRLATQAVRELLINETIRAPARADQQTRLRAALAALQAYEAHQGEDSTDC